MIESDSDVVSSSEEEDVEEQLSGWKAVGLLEEDQRPRLQENAPGNVIKKLAKQAREQDAINAQTFTGRIHFNGTRRPLTG